MVQFDRVSEDLKGPKVVNNNYNGAFNATKHLLEQGYRKIIHFGGGRVLNAYRERESGFIDALNEFGIENQFPVYGNIITRESAYKEFSYNFV